MIQLLNGHTLNTLRFLHPSRVQLTQSRTGVSTGTMEVTAQDAVSCGDWLSIDTVQGFAGIFRVKTVETDAETGSQSISFSHLIESLEDGVLYGNLEPADLLSDESATTIAQNTCIQKILTYQPETLWTLGTCPFTAAQKFTFNNATCLNAIQSVLSSCSNWTWSFNMSAIPFTLNISTKPQTATCEMRMKRNIASLKYTVDRSDMYTRFYPIGYENLMLTEGYVEQNTALYGVIEKSEANTCLETESLLRSWATERLSLHSHPTVTVTISGVDLTKTTGETLDTLTIGTMCRVPVRELNTTFEECIETLSWSDLIGTPEAVTVTLSNAQDDVKSFLEKIVQEHKSGGGGGSGGKADKDWYTLIDQQADYINLTYQRTISNAAYISELQIAHDAITLRVSKTEGDISEANASIAMHSDQILARVEKDGVISSINQTPESITISASKINLSGYCTISRLSTEIASIQTSISSSVNTSSLTSVSGSINQLTCSATFSCLGHRTSWKTVVVDGTTYHLLGY